MSFNREIRMHPRRAIIIPLFALIAVLSGCQNAVRTIAVSADSVDAFLSADDADRAMVKANLPQVHAAAEQLRRDFPKQCQAALDAVLVYQRTGAPDDAEHLKSALAVVQESARLARLYLAQMAAAQTKKGT
jgi:hypothetical protein